MRELFTGIDGISHDLGRYSWAASWAGLTAGAGANWWHGAAIDLSSLAIGYGAIATAHGAALFLKRDTEPKPPEEPKS